MRGLRLAMAAVAVAALVAAPEADARKGHRKGHEKRAHWVRVERVERRSIEHELAALVAARPRLPDGPHIVPNTRPSPAPRGIASAPARRPTRSMPTFTPSPGALADQRRASAVDAYLRSHPPAY